MASKRAFTPSLEALEGRWTPASVRLAGGVLAITGNNTADNYTLTFAAGNKVAITLNSAPLGTFSAGKLININTQSGDDTVTLDLTAAKYTGSVLLNLGNGTDAATVDGTSIGGNLTALGGAGNDTLSVGATAATAVGGALTYDGGIGVDSFVLSNASSVGGAASISRVNVVAFGDGTNAATAASLSVSNAAEAIGDLVALNANSSVLGNFSYVGSSAANTVVLSGTVGGATSLASGGGSDSLIATGATLMGSLTFAGGEGDDSVTFTGLAVGGNAVLNLGNGNNMYTVPAGNLFAGDLTITAGNGGNTLSGFAAAVAGNLNLRLGNGANTFELASGGAVGGDLNYQGGSDIDTVTISAPVGGAVRALLGAGADTFTWDLGASAGSLFIDFGDDADTFVVNDTLPSQVTILNLP